MYLANRALILAVFWMLLSGYFKPLMLGFGVLSVMVVLVFLKRMDEVDDEPMFISSGHRILRYAIWLLGQIALSSIHVTRLIWAPAGKLSPSLEKISVHNTLETTRVIYANSITLTPGTLSVDLEGDEITVHALQRESIEELKSGDMERKITSIWGGSS